MKIAILTPTITASQFLKISNLISSGGQSKIFLNQNVVLLNGTRLLTRNTKLKHGDVLIIDNEEFLITKKG